MTPQQLMDLPSAGMAQRQLIKDGQWNPHAGMKLKKWRVKVDYQVKTDESDTITVEAYTEEHALEVAIDDTESDDDVINNSVEPSNAECIGDAE